MKNRSAFHDHLIAAAREFNSGRYFEAHEALEEGLDDTPDELWELSLGLIQIAVGYHKLTQQLWVGGRRMLERALAKVEPFADDSAGLKLRLLRRRVAADIEALRDKRFDADAFKRDPPRLQPLR
ncbi:MAG TPA: DUF309 domain-containing protein [Candidatus Acidoferrales bacterium]|nr:DUF309 domain-containing protein [Candidatus Acidoferrales bacterium]